MRFPLYFLLAAAAIACGTAAPLKLTLKGQLLSAELESAQAKGGNGGGQGGGNGGERGSGGNAGGNRGGAGGDNANGNARGKDRSNDGDVETAHEDRLSARERPVAGVYFRLRLPPPELKRARAPHRVVPRTSATRRVGTAARGSIDATKKAPNSTASPKGRPRDRSMPDGIVVSGLTTLEIGRLTQRGLTVARATTTAQSKVIKFRLPAGMSPEAGRRAVKAVNAYAVADTDAYYYTDGHPADCLGASCGAAEIRWSGSSCGAPPVIGMIDTRIDTNHEALAGQDVEMLELPGHVPTSSSDHGTAIAALLAGRRDSKAPGLLPAAKIVSVDAFAMEDGIERADVIRLVDAIEALWRRGVRIVNLSLSGPPNAVLEQAIDRALARGMILIAAAGNGGPGGKPAYPAAYPGVIAVTAVDHEMRIYSRATRGDYIALAAPGVGLKMVVAPSSEASRSGTSFAVPYVTAAVASLLARDSALDDAAVTRLLSSSARDLGRPGRDPVYGWGLLQTAGICDWPEETSTPAIARDMTAAQPATGSIRKGQE